MRSVAGTQAYEKPFCGSTCCSRSTTAKYLEGEHKLLFIHQEQCTTCAHDKMTCAWCCKVSFSLKKLTFAVPGYCFSSITSLRTTSLRLRQGTEQPWCCPHTSSSTSVYFTIKHGVGMIAKVGSLRQYSIPRAKQPRRPKVHVTFSTLPPLHFFA